MIQVQLKLKLTPAQERRLTRWLWHLTAVYNWTLKTIERDAHDHVYRSLIQVKALLNGHSQKLGIPATVLSGTVATAHDAWRRCFRKLARKPRLKGRRNRLSSIAMAHGREVRITADTANIPGVGRVRFHRQEIPEGRIGTARIVQRASGWYLCLFIHAEQTAIQQTGAGEVGIDPGFTSLLTLSTGEKIEHPNELRAIAKRLAQAQRGQRKQLTARLHERQANQRRDRNHKLSRLLVAEYALIAWSKDPTARIARSFGKSVTSASHSQLRQMLTYKSRTGGRQFIEVPSRNSTKTCSTCGALTGPTGRAGLSVRHWVCPCGAAHDRDVNAAVNTLKAGAGIALERARKGISGIAA